MKTLLAILISFAASSAFAANNWPTRGSADASVTIVMYGDLQCPFCKMGVDRLNDALKDFPKDVKVVFRNYPLEFHDQAMNAARAGVCAQAQGKFWEFHDLIYGQKIEEVRELTAEKVDGFAQQAGLDMRVLSDCRQAPDSEAVVNRDKEEGELLGLTGTPMFVIVGPEGVKRLNGAYPAEDFVKAIREVGKF